MADEEVGANFDLDDGNSEVVILPGDDDEEEESTDMENRSEGVGRAEEDGDENDYREETLENRIQESCYSVRDRLARSPDYYCLRVENLLVDRSDVDVLLPSSGSRSRRFERFQNSLPAGSPLERSVSTPNAANSLSFWAKRVSRNFQPQFLLDAFEAGRSWLTQKKKPYWTRLPDTIILNIFQMLQDEDRVRLSCVCKRWWCLLHVPELWRRRTVSLDKRGVLFTEVFGACVRELTLVCNPIDWSLECAKTIFSNLGKAHIRMLEFSQVDFNILRPLRCGGILWESVIHFLEGQKKLEQVDFSFTFLPRPLGCRVLSAIPTTATLLLLQNFFAACPDRSPAFESPELWSSLHGFPGLVELHVNYDCLSDFYLELLASSPLGSRLLMLGVNVYALTTRRHTLHPETWRQLTLVNPKLKVDMALCEVDAASAKRLLSRRIPLSSVLLYATEEEGADPLQLCSGDTLLHIARSCPALTALEFKDDFDQDVEAGILAVVKSCPRLTLLCLQCNVTTAFLDELLTLQVSGRAHLKDLGVNLTAYEVDVDEIRTWCEILLRHQQKLSSSMNVTVYMADVTLTLDDPSSLLTFNANIENSTPEISS